MHPDKHIFVPISLAEYLKNAKHDTVWTPKHFTSEPMNVFKVLFICLCVGNIQKHHVSSCSRSPHPPVSLSFTLLPKHHESGTHTLVHQSFRCVFHLFLTNKECFVGASFSVCISCSSQSPIYPSLRFPRCQVTGNEVFVSPTGGMKRAFVSPLQVTEQLKE